MEMENRLTEGIMVPLLFLGYLVLWKIKKRELVNINGDDPEVIFSDSRPTQKYFAHLSRLLTVAIALLVTLHSMGVDDIAGFNHIELLDNRTANFFGFLLGLGGLALCRMAQRQMGLSWRVGLDRQQFTALVTTGVFRKIRNPTYSGLLMICTGSFIIFPTMSFMVWVIAFCIAIEFQVRLEEEHLLETHGKPYAQYRQITKRYIPYIY